MTTDPSSVDWKTLSETVFNFVKASALVAAGVWTVYQWDRVLFPKETHEEFKRRAEVRTDLSPEAVLLSLDKVDSAEEAEKSDGAPADAVRFLARVQVRLANRKDFPIALVATPASLKVFGSRDKTAAKASRLEQIKFSLAPSKVVPISTHDFLGRAEGQDFVVEAEGAVIAGHSVIISIPYDLPHEFLRVEFHWELPFRPVDPRSNQAVDALRRKRVVKSSVILRHVVKYREGETALGANVDAEAKVESRDWQLVSRTEDKWKAGETVLTSGKLPGFKLGGEDLKRAMEGN